MAKAKETKEAAAENEVLNAAETGEAADTAAVPKNDGYVDILVPMNVLTGPEDTHVPVVLNGKIYQVKVGETVRVPKGVACILQGSMAQKKKVQQMIKAKSAQAKNLNQE